MDIFSAFGLSVSAGLNAYIPLIIIALLARFTDLIKLQSPWDFLTSWWVIGVLVVLSLVEFFADKVPAVNHINDIIQTFIRPTAGAIAFAASAHTVTNMHPVISIIAGILVAGSVHAFKSLAVRPAVSVTTAGVGNVPVSIAEDIISIVTSIIAIVLPILISIIIILILLIFIVIFWRRSSHKIAY